MSVAALLLAAASPAAQAPAAPHVDPAILADPATQQVLALQLAALAGIVLDTKFGPLAALADPHAGVRPGDTLRSVEHRRDPEFERHLYENAHSAVAAAGAVAVEAKELQRTADRLRAALAPLTGNGGGDR